MSEVISFHPPRDGQPQIKPNAFFPLILLLFRFKGKSLCPKSLVSKKGPAQYQEKIFSEKKACSWYRSLVSSRRPRLYLTDNYNLRPQLYLTNKYIQYLTKVVFDQQMYFVAEIVFDQLIHTISDQDCIWPTNIFFDWDCIWPINTISDWLMCVQEIERSGTNIDPWPSSETYFY